MSDVAVPGISPPTDQALGVRTGTRLATAGLVAACFAVVALAAAPALVPRSLLQDVTLVFLLVALAQAWNLLAGYAGMVSVGQQAFVGVGGYGLFALVTLIGIDPLVATPVAALVGALLAIPLGAVVFRLRGPYFAVVTWVVAEILRLALAQWKDLGGGTGTSLPRLVTNTMMGLEATATILGIRNAAAREVVIYWAALALAVAVVAVVYLILRSRLGLALASLRDNEVASESIGIDATRAKFKVYVFAAFVGAFAGALIFLQKGRISPDAAFSVIDWTAYIIFVVVIGGIGTIEGPILGAILFVILQAYFADLGPWYLIGLGALGIVIILVAPRGVWGTLAHRFDFHIFPTRRRLVLRDEAAVQE
jgi:branched-chain amino acid transport system permease protein